jgi:deoxyribodipyrimidine photo-lyase
MIAARRTAASYALDRALALTAELARPLVVLEPLRAGYQWASERLHAFVLQGMADNAAAFAAAGVTYLPYVEPEPGRGRGLLEALAARGIVGGCDLSADYPALANALLVCATETRTPADIAAYAGALADVMKNAAAA